MLQSMGLQRVVHDLENKQTTKQQKKKKNATRGSKKSLTVKT